MYYAEFAEQVISQLTSSTSLYEEHFLFILQTWAVVSVKFIQQDIQVHGLLVSACKQHENCVEIGFIKPNLV